MNWIQSLADITLADLDRVGGKAAHLGAMLRAGFPIPPGFVIDVSAFTSHFGEVTDSLVKPNAPLLQAELMADVMQALMDHLGAEEQLAVRSSSTEEDGSQASFAGQHSTYYFVPPNQIDQAIIDCWMSLWSPAALAYRRSGWAEVTSGDPVRMAIVVQKMLPATRSGVAFSRDPIKLNNNDCVIEASWGLGAALVDGRVTPDHIRIDETENLLSYVVSDKQFQVSASPSNHNAQRLQEVPRERREARVLEDSEACSIANIAAQLEVLFEAPQDVEWAYVNDDFYLLQSRPVTTRPQQHDIQEKLVLFKPLAENFTEPLTPLSEDLYASVLPGIGCLFDGRMYLNLDLVSRLNPFDISEEELVNAVLLRGTPQQAKLDWRKTLAGFAALSAAFLVDGANWIRTARASRGALARYSQLIKRVRNNPDISAADAMQRLIWGRHFFEPIGHHMLYANVSAGRYFLYIGFLKACVQRWAPDYPINELSRTYHGRADMQSMALLDQLDRLSESLHEALDRNDSEGQDIASAIEGKRSDLPVQALFTIQFEEFLQTFGHRGPREMELAAPCWREAPNSLLKILNSYTPQGSRRTKVHGAHLAARDELHQQLKPWQRRVTAHIYEKVTKYIALREDTRHFHIMGFDVVRQKILEIERSLLHAGKLTIPGDIFFLRNSDIEALIEERMTAAEANQLIRSRRRDWHRQARTPAQETINIEMPEVQLVQVDLTGQCACPGQVEGIARIIHSLSDAHTLKEGEILVAPYTDPAWTPLFSRAGGIVVGTGSFLSHAGTVARELQVPCLVDVKNCMDVLHSGQRLRLDASSGRIEVMA